MAARRLLKNGLHVQPARQELLRLLGSRSAAVAVAAAQGIVEFDIETAKLVPALSRSLSSRSEPIRLAAAKVNLAVEHPDLESLMAEALSTLMRSNSRRIQIQAGQSVVGTKHEHLVRHIPQPAIRAEIAALILSRPSSTLQEAELFFNDPSTVVNQVALENFSARALISARR